jgi:hypothetical protein
MPPKTDQKEIAKDRLGSAGVYFDIKSKALITYKLNEGKYRFTRSHRRADAAPQPRIHSSN